MPDLIEQAEAVRNRLGLRQIEVAAALGVTQGHYSKVANGRTPLAKDLEKRLHTWVEANRPDDFEDRDMVSNRMAALAASIQQQCLELLELSSRSSLRPADLSSTGAVAPVDR